ncbi:alpha/beta hydrolase family protein [Actinomadura fibrosa]|uniref:Alpha/beta hydrolase family protein n=1 Tax=Actinomadura fibrosa TaxID=111802 RepID=A0ABW2XCW8_9ACTN|nr:lipase [Actinomadura fibrosa]
MLASGLLVASLGTAKAMPVAAGSGPAPSPQVQFTLPAPTGHQRVGTVSLHLVDRSRPDPWVPAQPDRHLMIQIWYPAATVRGHPNAPWMTPAIARAYERLNNLPVLNWPTTAGHVGAPVQRRRAGWPVLLYSHGLGGWRTEATALIEDLASRGYVVVTIDHTHDAFAVEFPDGRLEPSAIPELTDDNEVELTTKAVEARVADTRFVLDQLAALNRGRDLDADHRRLPHGLRGALDLARVGMFGQSDGGTTTAAALHDDSRLTAGINLDGTLWTPAAVAGSRRPLLLFGRQEEDAGRDASWATFWANQRGPKLRLKLAGAAHDTFLDFAVLLPQAAPILGIPPDEVAKAAGTIEGRRAAAVVRAYVSAYFDRYLRGRHSDLLDGPSSRYPEVRFAP